MYLNFFSTGYSLFLYFKITSKNEQFSYEILQIVKSLPVFEIILANFDYDNQTEAEIVSIELEIKLKNLEAIKNSNGGYLGTRQPFVIMIGDEKKNVVHFSKIKYLTSTNQFSLHLFK